jgi:hypothetical protein
MMTNPTDDLRESVHVEMKSAEKSKPESSVAQAASADENNYLRNQKQGDHL